MRARGFTLIEVLVALAIVALGMSALMAALTSAADATSHLRYKSFAEWIALNRVAEQRIAQNFPAEGKVNGTSEFGGLKWRWVQTVAPAGYGNMMRIDVSVSLDPESGGKKDAEMAVAAGFFSKSVTQNVGTSVATPVDWDGTQWKAADAQRLKDLQQKGQNGTTPANPGGGDPRPPSPALSNPASRQ